MLVCNLGIHADELRMIERWYESQIGTRRWQIDVTARFVRFRLQRKLVSILLVDAVLAKVVDGFAQVLQCVIRPATRVRLGAFASTPKHENSRAELRSYIHGANRLLHCILAYLTIVGGESTIAKYRIIEEIDGCHGDYQAMSLASRLEVANDPLALGPLGVNRDKIAVVKVDPPSPDFSEKSDEVVGRDGRTNRV